MDFGRKILSKYGWSEGEGLGKDNNGIAQPIKPKLKFDTKGLGVNEAENELNNHWWQRVFKEAANNLQVEQCDGDSGVKLKAKKDNEVEISTKSYSIKKLKKIKDKSSNTSNSKSKDYANFLPSTVLTSGNCEVNSPNKIDVSTVEYEGAKILSDEELFKACEGRTAHKAARHGMKLSGKLLRVEQQDKDLLSKLYKKSVDDTAESKLEIFERNDKAGKGDNIKTHHHRKTKKTKVK